MPGGVYTICLRIKTKKSFRMSRITNENTVSSSGFKLMSSVRSKIGITCTTKIFKVSKVRRGVVELRLRGFPIKN